MNEEAPWDPGGLLCVRRPGSKLTDQTSDALGGLLDELPVSDMTRDQVKGLDRSSVR